MAFKKGQSGNPAGRPAGVPNKVNGQLKDMILQALDGAGGVAYLQTCARDNPTAFLSLVGRVLPIQQQHSGTDGAPLTVIQRVETRAGE